MTADTPQRASAYVHFPWCLAKCPYCDFVSYASPKEAIDHAAYADAVLREVDARAPSFAGRRVESVFFGGGTPSLWEPAELGRVLAGVRRAFALSSSVELGGMFPGSGVHGPELEVTVECNPTSLDEKRAQALAEVGVGRISIGVQSLRDERLRYLGRLHDAKGARDAVQDALRAGIARVSADLIFGLPGQSPADARDEALELSELGLSHLSCYQLTVENGTRFGELARRGRLPLAEDGAVADGFLAIDEVLTARGWRHYEVSNYARPGEEARHNLGYWRGDEYLGLGCAAVGYVGTRKQREPASGVRYRNMVRPESYVEATLHAKAGPAAGEGDGISESSERLDAATLLRERIMLGLRVAEGVDIDDASRRLSVPGWTPQRTRAAAWLEQRGRIVREGSRIRIPRAAWLWTDDTAARLF